MLTLPIKRMWFDMIASGEKKEDAVNLYDATKIVRHGGLSTEPLPMKDFFRKE